MGDTKKSEYIYIYQYLRVYMLFLVFIQHFTWLFSETVNYLYFFADASEAVSFFFCLSGFLFFRTYKRIKAKLIFKYLKNLFCSKKSYIYLYWISTSLSLLYCVICAYYSNVNVYKDKVTDIGTWVIHYFGLSVLFGKIDIVSSFTWFFQILILCYLVAPIFEKRLSKINANSLVIIAIGYITHLLLAEMIQCEKMQIFYIDAYHNPLLRFIEFYSGYLISKQTEKQQNHIIYIIFIVGILSLEQFFLRYGNVRYSLSFTYLCSILVIYFGAKTKNIVLKQNKIIDFICQNSFLIYIFHTIILLFTTLVPFPNPVWNAIVTIICLFILAKINSIITDKQKRIYEKET